MAIFNFKNFQLNLENGTNLLVNSSGNQALIFQNTSSYVIDHSWIGTIDYCKESQALKLKDYEQDKLIKISSDKIISFYGESLSHYSSALNASMPFCYSDFTENTNIDSLSLDLFDSEIYHPGLTINTKNNYYELRDSADPTHLHAKVFLDDDCLHLLLFLANLEISFDKISIIKEPWEKQLWEISDVFREW